MATYLLTSPDCRKFQVTAESPEKAYSSLQTMLKGDTPTPQA